jgi:hypothetical protein
MTDQHVENNLMNLTEIIDPICPKVSVECKKHRGARRVIPKAVRTAVFLKYCPDFNNAFCYVGCGEKITPFNFECGHVISDYDGGETTLENLRPICGQCNGSIGTRNLEKFITEYGFKKIPSPPPTQSQHETAIVSSEVKPSDTVYDTVRSSKSDGSDKQVVSYMPASLHISCSYRRQNGAYSCPICQYDFGCHSSLKYHMTHTVCQKVNMNRICPTCQRTFATKQKQQYHITHKVCSIKKQMVSDQPKIHLKLKEDANLSRNHVI